MIYVHACKSCITLPDAVHALPSLFPEKLINCSCSRILHKSTFQNIGFGLVRYLLMTKLRFFFLNGHRKKKTFIYKVYFPKTQLKSWISSAPRYIREVSNRPIFHPIPFLRQCRPHLSIVQLVRGTAQYCCHSSGPTCPNNDVKQSHAHVEGSPVSYGRRWTGDRWAWSDPGAWMSVASADSKGLRCNALSLQINCHNVTSHFLWFVYSIFICPDNLKITLRAWRGIRVWCEFGDMLLSLLGGMCSRGVVLRQLNVAAWNITGLQRR